MQNIKVKLGLIGGSVAGFLGLASRSYAQTVPTADADVVTATTNTITGLQSELLSNLATLIPIAAVLLISVAVVFFVIRHFRAIVKG